jgi:hypothetical protein
MVKMAVMVMVMTMMMVESDMHSHPHHHHSRMIKFVPLLVVVVGQRNAMRQHASHSGFYGICQYATFDESSLLLWHFHKPFANLVDRSSKMYQFVIKVQSFRGTYNKDLQ